MNLYFLIEDRRAGKQVYQGWLHHVFPHLSEVKSIDQIVDNQFFLLSGQGYPSYVKRIQASLTDIVNHGRIDHFFICIDTETMAVEQKLTEIAGVLSQSPPFAHTHVVPHHCCIETWFLGHARMLRANPQSELLRRYKRFYDVSQDDPEAMGCIDGNETRAPFHYQYLKAMLDEQNLVYSKNTAGPVRESHYLKALIQRHRATGHIDSFGKLIATWQMLGGSC